MWNQPRHLPSWQVVFAWLVGLLAVANIIIINLFPLAQVRFSAWIYVFPLVNTLSCIVTANAAFRERSTQRKIAWIFISGASFLAFHQFVFRTLLSYDDIYINVGMFFFLILGLASYFPRKIWSIGNTWRVISESLMLAFSVISLIQTCVYAVSGVNSDSTRAALYAVWVGFEAAALLGTIFLWRRYKHNVLIFIVLAAVCILLADITGLIRSWYPGIYRLTGLPDMSFSFIQYMSLMLFAYYSIEGLPGIQENEIRTLAAWEWFYWNGVPRTLFTISVVMAFFVHRSDTWVMTALFAVFVIQGIVALSEEFGLLTRITTANTHLVTAQAQLQQALLSAEELAVEHERTRVAAEIHDGLGGHLSAVKVHLQVAARVVEHDPPAAATSFASALEEAAAAQRELRRAIEALTAEYQLLPLDVQLAELARTSQRTGIRTILTIDGDIQPLPLPVHHALHRVAQEALNNARRHAQATQVTIALDFRTPGMVELRIADNGAGLPAGTPKVGGHGLRNMQNRIEPLGGTISIANQPEQQGVLVWARVPLTTRASG